MELFRFEALPGRFLRLRRRAGLVRDNCEVGGFRVSLDNPGIVICPKWAEHV
jgi:hypothetical protein